MDTSRERELALAHVGLGRDGARPAEALALACAVPRARWTVLGAMIAVIIQEVVADEADRRDGTRTMRLAGEETLCQRETGEDREQCASVANSFDALARETGAP